MGDPEMRWVGALAAVGAAARVGFPTRKRTHGGLLTEQVNVKMTASMLEEILAEAARLNVSPGVLIRGFIVQGLRRD